MVNFNDVIKEETTKHNSNRPEISDHPYRILRTEGSGSGKIDSLFNLIKSATTYW